MVNQKKLMGSTKFKKRKADITNKWTVIAFTTFVVFILAVLVGFIIYKSIPALQGNDFLNFIFSTIWNPGKNNDHDAKYGILSIIGSTMMMLLISLMFAIPLTIFSALFITEYLNKKLKNFVITIIQLLAGIPSVVFGLFALDQIGPLTTMMGAKNGSNMMTASITLAFMALPTMITLSINAIESVPDSHRFASLGLGLTKEKTTFGVVLTSAMPKIITAIITGVARIIGETMAVILIAGNSTQGLNTTGGFLDFIFSSIRTLAGTIGLEMLENNGSHHEAALYAIGLVLFFLVIIINLLILAIGNFNKRKRKSIREIKRKNKMRTKNTQTSNIYDSYKLTLLVKSCTDKRIKKKVYSSTMKFFMITSTAIIVGFTSWVILTVLFDGLRHFDASAFIQIKGQRSGIFATIFTTILLVIGSILFAIPLALFAAIYLAEYARKESKFAKTIRFSISVLSSTPSIVFGVFGLSLFVIAFKIPMSIFASSLTMTIVILPSLISVFEDAMTSVPEMYKEAAYGLGMTKTGVIWKVVLPNSMQGIVTGTILAIARIIGESAPVYLTLGTAVRMPSEGFLSSGATLTTQIYMMASEGSSPDTLNVAYQLALVTVLMVLCLNWFSKYIAKKLEPTYKKVKFKNKLINYFNKLWTFNYMKVFQTIRSWTLNIGSNIKNIFSFKKTKASINVSRSRNKLIKNIIKEARENDRKSELREKNNS